MGLKGLQRKNDRFQNRLLKRNIYTTSIWNTNGSHIFHAGYFRFKYSIRTFRHGDRVIAPFICLLTSSSDKCIVTATSAVAYRWDPFLSPVVCFRSLYWRRFRSCLFDQCACVPLFNLSHFFVFLPVPRSYVNPFLFGTLKKLRKYDKKKKY